MKTKNWSEFVKLASFFAMAIGFFACGAPSGSSNCTINDDCVAGYLCVEQSCRAGRAVRILTSDLPDGLVDAEYTATLDAADGVEPYEWSLLEGPGWIFLDAESGRLSGIPRQVGSGLVVRVQVKDSTSGRDSTAEASFTIGVAVCSDGQTAVCSEVQDGRCMVGRKVCSGGRWGVCGNMDFSTDKEKCGEDCGVCSNVTADRCRQGACVCGDGAECAGREICCEGHCVDGGQDGHCGVCGRVCGEAMVNVINPRCQDGVCVSDGCMGGFLDCDGDAGNGCEREISAAACGECQLDCTAVTLHVAQAECLPTADGYICGYSGDGTVGEGCQLGYLDCDGNRANGCEVEVSSTDCGACGLQCMSQCEVRPQGDRYWCTCEKDVDCGAGGLCCDHECKLATSVRTCGSCQNDCTQTVQHSPATCVGGQCGHGECEHGWLDCDNLAGNGCERPYSDNDCGQCGFACGANAYCDDGNCACGQNFGNCLDGWSDGCETDLETTVVHCGSCGHDCTPELQHVVQALCVGGQCDFTACQAGFDSCDDQRSNGCEENIWQTSACGTNCTNRVDCSQTVQNAVGARCGGGSCDYERCVAGYDNCDSNRANGCEENIWEVSDCGTRCSNRVDCNLQVMNAIPRCNDGECSYLVCYQCSNQNCWLDCDGQKSNGCEQTLRSVTSCGTSCENRANCETQVVNASGKYCNAGTCDYRDCLLCSSSSASCFHDCNGIRADGCESNIWQLHSCGQNCNSRVDCEDTVLHAYGVICDNSLMGRCNYSSCHNHYGDCDGNRQNGCESYFYTSVTNCGSCGHNCNDVIQYAEPVCNNGVCDYVRCTSLWGLVIAADCDGNRQNGCEVSLVSVDSCGTSCSNVRNCEQVVDNANGVQCNIVGAPPRCDYTSCWAGYNDCDGNRANGCERYGACP